MRCTTPGCTGKFKADAGELERRVAERTAELEHERQHLQAILDSAGEGIQIMDPDWHIMYVNPATEKITGYRAAEIIGHSTRLGTDSLNPIDKLNQPAETTGRGPGLAGQSRSISARMARRMIQPSP